MKNTVKTKKWDRPLSQKAYAKVIDKAQMMFRTMVDDYFDSDVIRYIDIYIDTRVAPVRGTCDYCVYITFMSVKWVIDEAMERSAKARRRAVERREKKEAGKAEKATETEATENERESKMKHTDDGTLAGTHMRPVQTASSITETEHDTDT